MGRRTAALDRPEDPLLEGALRVDDEPRGALRAEPPRELLLGMAERVVERPLRAELRLGAERDGARRVELDGALIVRLGAVRSAE